MYRIPEFHPYNVIDGAMISELGRPHAQALHCSRPDFCFLSFQGRVPSKPLVDYRISPIFGAKGSPLVGSCHGHGHSPFNNRSATVLPENESFISRYTMGTFE